VFAYEGSVFLAFAKQKPHPNAAVPNIPEIFSAAAY
jgi:hypothetical protein